MTYEERDYFITEINNLVISSEAFKGVDVPQFDCGDARCKMSTVARNSTSMKMNAEMLEEMKKISEEISQEGRYFNAGILSVKFEDGQMLSEFAIDLSDHSPNPPSGEQVLKALRDAGRI